MDPVLQTLYAQRLRTALVDPIREQVDDPPTSTSGTERYPFEAPFPALDTMPPSLREPHSHALQPTAELVVGGPRPQASGESRSARDVHRPGLIDEPENAPPDATQPALLYSTTPISSRASRAARGRALDGFRCRPRIAQSLDEPATDEPDESGVNRGPSAPAPGADPVARGEVTPWLGLDLDGTTLSKVTGKLPSGQPALGEPLEGVAEFVAELRALGWRVSTFTARFAFTNSDDLRRHWAQEIAQHLAERGIQVSDVWYGPKAPFHRIVDDRAIRFTGDFRAMLAEVTALGYGGDR